MGDGGNGLESCVAIVDICDALIEHVSLISPFQDKQVFLAIAKVIG